MSSRVSWTLIVLLSLGVGGGVIYFFAREMRSAKAREEIIADLMRLGREEGACAGLAKIRAVREPIEPDLRRTLDLQRGELVRDVLGTNDEAGRTAFLAGEAEGLIDRALCEQIQLVSGLGEVHPVMLLLRLTRGQGSLCDVTFSIDEVIDGLRSHRKMMLQALMVDTSRLKCLPPTAQQRLTQRILDEIREDPRVFDDTDVLRVASFLSQWAPLDVAQLGCWLEARGDTSKLANAVGCTPDHKSRVLIRYRYPQRLPGQGGAEPLPAGSEVLLLWSRDGQCDVRPVEDPPRAYTVACSDLTLASSVDIAVLLEPIVYGLAKADLIAGVARYDSKGDRLMPAPRDDPQLRSWFAYDRTGSSVGTTEVATLSAIAQRVGEQVPDSPLRTYCRQAGARYCYDVDWAQVVTKLEGEPVVFLSRPLGVFVQELTAAPDIAATIFQEAFGRAPADGASHRVYGLGPDGYLVLEVQPAGVEARWRLAAEGPWKAQGFGSAEGGRVPPSARLLAVLDLQMDGRPEIIVQRAQRTLDKGQIKDVSDEIVLMTLDDRASRFTSVNQLTVREY